MKQHSESPEAAPSGIPTRHLYAIIGLVVGFVGGFAFASYLAQSTPVAAATGPRAILPLEDLAPVGRPAWGPDNAPVTVVEFTDYECPFCARYFRETYPRLVDAYDDQIRYVVRNFPLTSIHRQAQKAAEAAECALDQGRFWEYHDILFERQQALETKNLKAYAVEVGLATDAFVKCLDSGIKADIVASDLEAGWLNGVRGTPTFFINGQILVGAQPFEIFEQVLRTAGAR